MKATLKIFLFTILVLPLAITLLSCNTHSDEERKNANQSSLSKEIKLFRSSTKSKKTIFVITGFGENPDSVVKKNKLFSVLLQKDFDLAFITSTNSNQTFYIRQDEINNVAKQIVDFKLANVGSGKTFSLLGFSLGGTACLKLLSDSAFCAQTKILSCVVIDPPIDMERLYNSLTRQKMFSRNPISKNESEFLLNFLKNKYALTTTPEAFWSTSVYSKRDTIYLNYRKIKDKNLLIFTNNDTSWQRVHRDRQSVDLHISDCVPFFEKIKEKNNAKLFVMEHSDTIVNPHSWDNVNKSLLINWLQ